MRKVKEVDAFLPAALGEGRGVLGQVEVSDGAVGGASKSRDRGQGAGRAVMGEPTGERK